VLFDSRDVCTKAFRIELTSHSNLNDADTGGGIYVKGSTCPYRDSELFSANGPVAAPSGQDLENWRSRGQPMTRDPKDGLYHYYVYLPAKPYKDGPRCDSCDSFPMPQQLDDLRKSRQPVCFRILTSSSGDRKIFVPPVQSATIEVAAKTLASAAVAR
jgi:hypothetical protein